MKIDMILTDTSVNIKSAEFLLAVSALPQLHKMTF